MTDRDDLAPSKASIIEEMFVHTADENYVVSRWSHDNGLITDFFWNALHALEKYMKAVLLFNGVTAKSHSHGLPGLYDEVEKIAGGLLPTMLTQPANLEIHHWMDMTRGPSLKSSSRTGTPTTAT